MTKPSQRTGFETSPLRRVFVLTNPCRSLILAEEQVQQSAGLWTMRAVGQEDAGPVHCVLWGHSVASHVLLSAPGSDGYGDSNAGWKNKAFSDCS